MVSFIIASVKPSGDEVDAETNELHFSVWNQSNVVYSLTKGRALLGGSLSVPHAITEERVAEREQLPLTLQDHDWSRGNKII